MKPKLTIIPFGGLANRLRVLNSAYELSLIQDFDLKLLWFKKAELFANLDDLFEDVGMKFQLPGWLTLILSKFIFKHIYVTKYETIYRKILSYFYDLIIFDSDIKLKSELQLLTEISKNQKVFIATCYSFLPVQSFSHLSPKADLIQEIEKIGIDENFIGIHIRRTDHAQIINESSDKMYEKFIEDKINNQKRIYLATDDIKLKSRLIQKYANQIISINIPLERDSTAGIKAALIEIYALSKCGTLAGNLKSSFLEMALKIGKNKTFINV